MTINDEQRERYGRLGYNALAESWERELDGQDCGGVLTWEESLEETAYRNEEAKVMAAAVSEAARKDLYAELRAAAESDLRLTTSLNGGKSYILTNWLTAQEEAE